ncbi:MAG: hypothetical protein AABW80_01450 [Nanoarchaeota archaeon]
MKRRGLAHLEIVLAFVLFIGVIGFGFYFLGHSNKVNLVEKNLDYIEREIKKDLTSEASAQSLKINTRTGNSFAVELTKESGENFAVENSSGDVINSKFDNGILYFDAQSGDIYTIRKSLDINEINDFSGSLPAHDENNYKLGPEIESSVYSEEKALGLNESYYNNYGTLLERYGIGNRVNFGFQIIFEGDGRITAESEVPESYEIFLRSERAEFLRSGGELEFAEVIVKVW